MRFLSTYLLFLCLLASSADANKINFNQDNVVKFYEDLNTKNEILFNFTMPAETEENVETIPLQVTDIIYDIIRSYDLNAKIKSEALGKYQGELAIVYKDEVDIDEFTKLLSKHYNVINNYKTNFTIEQLEIRGDEVLVNTDYKTVFDVVRTIGEKQVSWHNKVRKNCKDSLYFDYEVQKLKIKYSVCEYIAVLNNVESSDSYFTAQKKSLPKILSLLATTRFF